MTIGQSIGGGSWLALSAKTGQVRQVDNRRHYRHTPAFDRTRGVYWTFLMVELERLFGLLGNRWR